MKKESLRDTIKTAFSISEDKADNKTIRDCLLSGGKVTGTNLSIMICAMVIASPGWRSLRL